MAKPELLQYKEFSNPFIANHISHDGLPDWQLDWLKRNLGQLTLKKEELDNIRFLISRNMYGGDGHGLAGVVFEANQTPEDTVVIAHDALNRGTLAHEMQHIRDLRYNRNIRPTWYDDKYDQYVSRWPYIERPDRSELEDRAYKLSDAYKDRNPLVGYDGMPRNPYSLADTLLLMERGMQLDSIPQFIQRQKAYGY